MVQALLRTPSLADLAGPTVAQTTPTLTQLIEGTSQGGSQDAIDSAAALLVDPGVDASDTSSLYGLSSLDDPGLDGASSPYETGNSLTNQPTAYGVLYPSTDLGRLPTGFGEPVGQSVPEFDPGKLNQGSSNGGTFTPQWGSVTTPSNPTTTGASEVKKGADDLSQGHHYGDCGLIAAIGEVATVSPRTIDDNIKPASINAQGQQTYDVKLFVDNNWKTFNVTASDTHWSSSSDGANYGALYEAAAAKALGGPDKVQHQWTQDMLHMITGQTISNQEGAKNQTKTLDAVQNGAMAVAEYANNGVYDAKTGVKVSATTPGPGQVQLYGLHAYAVLKVSGQAPDRSVTLHNPWGQGEGSGGTFTVSEEAFKKMFGKSGFTQGQTSV